MVNTAAPPLRPAERSILFSGKSVRLSDDAQSAASSHAPKKRMRSEGSLRSRPARRGRLSFAYFSLAKQRKVSAPSARDAWLKLHPTLTTKHQLIFGLPQILTTKPQPIFRLPHLTHTKRQPKIHPTPICKQPPAFCK